MLAQFRLLIGFSAFFTVNLWLWSLPLSHQSLFLLAAPLGILYFVAFMWYVMRTASDIDDTANDS
jgi:cytosine/uracil/thiamine/allantoin permease